MPATAPAIGYTMEYCPDCGKMTNHKIVEICGKTRKWCVTCDEKDFVLESTRD